MRALGIGVLPGILALAVHSIGMLGKLFADAIEQTDAGPREAVRSTGVGYFREMINAVVPQVIPSWIGTFVYRIDINLRMSVVLGFVGAGGIGFALQDALRGLIYPRALGIVLVILVIIVGDGTARDLGAPHAAHAGAVEPDSATASCGSSSPDCSS